MARCSNGAAGLTVEALMTLQNYGRLTGAGPTDVSDALEVLLDPALEPIVEVVLVSDGDALEAHAPMAPCGSTGDGTVLSEQGRNPLADQATDRFAGLASERACAAARPPGQQLSVRLRAGGAVLRPSVRAGPVRDPHGGAQLGGPGRASG